MPRCRPTLFSIVLAALMLPIVACGQASTPVGDIRLPDGFFIEVFADDIPDARSLALGEAGTVFVSSRRDGRVSAILVEDGVPGRVVTLAEDLRTPNGIDVFDGDLYVAETERLLRFPDIENNLRAGSDYEVVADDFPGERHHGWRYIKFGPDGRLYMSIGAPCNVCDRDGFATIVSMKPDATDRRVHAYGVRNSVGLEFHPETGDLWFTDNGRDMLGDDLPPGELNVVSSAGEHFGFPFCHAGTVADPEFGDQRSCAEFRAPAMPLGPHVAPLGLAVYDGDLFPARYKGAIFIAEHGSWNRSSRIGYRISMVPVTNGEPTGYDVFAEGWLQGEAVSGRPVDVLLMGDGSLLVSDDHAGRVYRISFAQQSTAGDADD